MNYYQLNGYYCGICETKIGTKEEVEQKRSEWIKQGRTCWIIDLSGKHNRQFLDA